MKFCFIAVFMFSLVGLRAQSVNGFELSELTQTYIKVTSTRTAKNQVIVKIDYGQPDKALKANDNMVMDKDGKQLILNSPIDMLNFFDKLGYEMIQYHRESVRGTQQSDENFYMKKKE